MKTTTAGMDSHLAGSVTTLATIWRLVRTDGKTFYFTDHDRSITFEGIEYQSSVGYTRSALDNKVGMSVDNMETTGFLDSDSLTEDELRAGLFDYAEVYIAAVNYENLADGQVRLRRGKLGEVVYSEVTNTFKAELRGLTQLYSQRPVELYQAECRADLGDGRCRVDLFPDVVRPIATYAVGDVVRGAAALDGLPLDVLLVPADVDADDISGNAAVGTLGTQAAVQTTTKVFGAGALEFSPFGSVDPAQAFVEYADIGAYALGQYDFTLEGRVRFKDLTVSLQTFASQYLNSGDERSWYFRRNAGNLEFGYSTDGITMVDVTGAFAWAIDTWYHVAVCRDGNNLRLFVDGTQVGSTADVTGVTIFDSAEGLRLGKLRSVGFDDYPLYGFMDDWRLAFGAVYTVGFTPPAAALEPLQSVIDALVPVDFEDVVYDVTGAGETGGLYPDFDPAPGNTTTWGGVTFTAREAYTRAATVATVTDNRTFTVTFTNGPDSREVDDWFTYGAVVWGTGLNAGLTMEVKGFVAATDTVTLFLAMPFEVQVGDALSIYAGCDKRLTTCINKLDNVLNFRGEPYVPGQDEFLGYPSGRQ